MVKYTWTYAGEETTFYDAEPWPVRRVAGGKLKAAGDLTELPARLLVALIGNRGTLMTYEELTKACWGDAKVERNTIQQHISDIHKLIGTAIKNHPRIGYTFLPEEVTITEISDDTPEPRVVELEKPELKRPPRRLLLSRRQSTAIGGICALGVALLLLARGCTSGSPAPPSAAAQGATRDSHSVSGCTYLEGAYHSDLTWGSGYVILKNAIPIMAGSQVRVDVEGPAKRILVRLLARDQNADQPDGVLGRFDVNNGVVVTRIAAGRPNIWQVSVHGGEIPFGKSEYDLGPGNGAARLKAAYLCKQ